MFITTFLTIAKMLKQLKGPSTDEWIRTTRYMYTCNGILCSLNILENSDTHYKSATKGQILYESISVRYPECSQ